MADAPHRRLRWVIGAALAVLALLAMLAAALHTTPAQRYLFARVQESLTADGVRLTAKAFGFSLFSGSLRLREVEIAAQGSPLPPLLRASSADVDFSTRGLLGGRVRLSQVNLSGLRIHYFVDAQGRDNLPR
ncbi:MAG: hypothetical protein SFV51_25275, partial [Bryobacteraceae bacterium]|nr:hypothetical protein [Bryobacteraceae bacterium]